MSRYLAVVKQIPDGRWAWGYRDLGDPPPRDYAISCARLRRTAERRAARYAKHRNAEWDRYMAERSAVGWIAVDA